MEINILLTQKIKKTKTHKGNQEISWDKWKQKQYTKTYKCNKNNAKWEIYN